MSIWDISVPVSPGLPVWPGDPPITLNPLHTIAGGDEVNVTAFSGCVHVGTHVDAPLHFLDGGESVEHLSLEVLMGPALVVELLDVDEITPDHLDALALPPHTRRILFKTRNSALWDDSQHSFYPNFVALTSDAAAWLVQHHIELVGIDYLSIQLFHDARPLTHQRLLEAGVVILEGLDLRAVQPGTYHLVCLPLKLVGCDGAPARAVLVCEKSG